MRIKLPRRRLIGDGRLIGDDGMASAEYAVCTLAAVAFAGVLLKVLTSKPVEAALTHLIQRGLG